MVVSSPKAQMTPSYHDVWKYFHPLGGSLELKAFWKIPIVFYFLISCYDNILNFLVQKAVQNRD